MNNSLINLIKKIYSKYIYNNENGKSDDNSHIKISHIILKFVAFVVILLVGIKLKQTNIYFSRVKLNIYNSTFIKTAKKLAIILPIDYKVFDKKLIYMTLNSIYNLKYNYTLFIIYNNKCPKINNENVILIKTFFISVYAAFNKIIKSIEDYDYVTFLLPGIKLRPNLYNFLSYIKDYDIYQVSEIKQTSFYEKLKYKDNSYFPDIILYKLKEKLPNNNNVVYDKIYSLKLLKKNNIKFISHEKSQYYFNLLAFSYSENLLAVKSYGIILKDKNVFIENYNDLLSEYNIIKRIISLNKNTTKALIIENNKIDFVFPYVTTRDPYWKELYNSYLSGKESNFSIGINRFRDDGLLKFLFRGLEKYLPWINRVHMIVMCKSQIPKWVNTDNVHIIYHDDFIPKKYLPSFSSSLIETFLPFLPSVEERFIYGNDDLIPCRYLEKNFFFRGNIPIYNLNFRDIKDTACGDPLRINAFNLILGKKQNKRVVYTQHSTVSYKMSWIKNCFKKYEKTILNSLSRFREDKNFNQYLYSFYQMMEYTILNIPSKIGLYDINTENIDIIIKKNFSDYDFVCLNDEIESGKKEWLKIRKKLKTLFPKKSKYEL